MTSHSGNNNTRIGLAISLCSNSTHLISFSAPQIASNFRHLLSCGTIVTFGTHRPSREGQTSRVACLAFILISKNVLNVSA